LRVPDTTRSIATPTPGDAAAARWVRYLERGLLVAGIGLFAVLLREIGPHAVFDHVGAAGWGIALIVLQEAVAFLCNTLGWWYAFPRPRPPLRFGHVLAVRMAGDAINYVTPTALLGGEFVRVRLLREHVPAVDVVASVTIAKLAQTIGHVAFIVLGLFVLLVTAPLPPRIEHGLMLAVGFMALFALAFLIGQRRGLFAPLLRALQTVGIGRSAVHLGERLRHLDREIAAFHAHGRQFAYSVAWFFAGWAWGLVEVGLILWLLDIPVTFHMVLAIEVLSTTIDGVLFFVPGKVGTQEGGKVLIFTLLGLDAVTGLAFGILRRIRELAWAGLGLLIFSRLHGERRALTRPAPAQR
jgi:putative membrane protein